MVSKWYTIPQETIKGKTYALGPSLLDNLKQQNISNTIIFISSPIHSISHLDVSNLGADKNAAVTTDSDSVQLFPNLETYLLYYVVRQTLTILMPNLKLHVKGSNCYLHAKTQKSEVIVSAKSGNICKNCNDNLANKLTPTIIKNLKSMAHFVSQRMP